ncbi:hypothetical protein [Halomonas maura]|uniref:hypothetical protein n=1 Tax=Halomonas maura TaxID=117606 RepID=UPI0025B45D7A|nr:hypothetical protein [Halomonas maura]MDN3558199.1 hypothetical protein [Halomonas maura]
MIMKNARLLIGFIMLATVFGCTDSERFDSMEPPVSLIDDIVSYQSLDVFKASLGSGYSWELLPDQRSSFSGDKYRPPFEVESLLIRDFFHLGHRGNLLVVFFNNRLAKTLFYPSNYDGYLAALSSEIEVDLIVIKEAQVRSHVRIWVATDHQGNNYIGWEDERLADEMIKWIKKYA